MTKQNRVETHFTERWRERGNPDYDGFILQRGIVLAHKQLKKTGHSDIIEKVTDTDKRGSDDCSFYRFRINNVPYYVIISERTSKILTLYDHDMMRDYKGKIRKAKVRRSKATLGGKRARLRAAEARRKNAR